MSGAEVEGDRLPYLGGGVGRYRPDPGVFAGRFEGITGDPQLATAETGETGEKVYALITDWVTDVIRRDWAVARGARRRGAAARPGARASDGTGTGPGRGRGPSAKRSG